MKLRRKERRFLAIILALVMVVGMIPANQITAYAGEVVSKVWNFRGGQDGAFAETVEGTTGEFDGIIIDATSGKCSARTQGDTQINAGTVLNIPVSGKGTVTVKTYPGYHGYEINGMAADADEYTYTYEGSAGYVTLTATSQMYLYEVATLCEESDEVTTEPGGEAGEEVAKEDKIDVWDLGAEQLDETKYNNLLTEDIINGFYEGVAAGTKGAKLPSFTVYDEDGNEDFLFNDGGYSSTHRLRTTNANLTHYDDKSLTFGGVTYTGYIYSNKSATSDVYVGIRLQKNDILTLCVSSNSGASNICVESPSGKVDSQVYDRSDKGTVLNFYASEDGIYKVYSSNEKLLLARAYREHTKTVEVTGTVTVPSTLSNCEIAFENAKTGEVTTAKAVDGKYTVSLNEQYDYKVSLVNANGYVIASDKTLAIAKNAKDVTFDVAVNAVELVTVTGKVTGLDSDALAKLEVILESDNIYIPSFVLDGDTYTAVLEKGVEYKIVASNVNDYEFADTSVISAETDKTIDINFKEKTKYDVTLNLEGVDNKAISEVTFTNLNEDGYVYTFTSTDNISLRDGVYKVVITKDGYTQKLTSNLKVNGSAVTKTVKFEKITEPVVLEYKSEITVGTNGDYTTINDALDAIRAMDRTDDERVTVYIEPGNYEEMIVVDVDNVTLKNASENPSLEVINKGVDIADNAVRITSYYGHGYYYYSMGSDCKYDEEVLAVNKENGYYSYANPGSGTTNGSYWNATAVIKADGFSADGIIFENSYNQYISEKEANDIVVEGAGSKGDRNSLPAGSTAVQDKSYVERAAALAVTDNVKKASFDNCKFIGRQDTLYGGKNSTVAFNQCDILGATDYIFGGMTAVFFKCNLVLNTSDSANDVAYITAAQQASGRGYLMYNCNITSTTPGVDTASTKVSKAGYFGRPWSANTSEVVYYYTVIGEDSQGVSLVEEEGWNSSLGGTSPLSYEYGTYELTGVDNSSSRADWSKVLDTPVLSDGTAISIAAFLGNWQPFEGEDLSITLPDGTKIDANEPEIEEPKEDDNQFTKRDWNFAAFGTGVNTSTNTYSENADGTITVASTKAKGKLVPASTDGLAFYYTAIDADKENFVLNAKVTVDSWTLSNGQEGFGLMAADAVGTNGDATTFWNNSYMAVATKTEYYYDADTQSITDDTTKAKMSMKLGIGAQEKKGVTTANIADGTVASVFSHKMSTLETTCAASGAGTYNLIGNYTNESAPTGTIANPLTTLNLTIARNNTGYVLTYTDEDGNEMSKLYYDLSRDALTQIDKDNIYIGFFASRNATITVSDVKLTVTDPETDAPAEEEETTYITPSYVVTSPTTSGREDYDLTFRGNADGTLVITDANGNEVKNEAVKANTNVVTAVKLTEGVNDYSITFTPDADYAPGAHQKLTSYDAVTFAHSVTYKTFSTDTNIVYVSPEGLATNNGTKESPLDIYTAVAYARAGQKIVLAGGTYNLNKTIVTNRGVDGTEGSLIYMIADPQATERPVFDFNSACAGMVLAGDYWYFYGFDVTKSADAQKGIQLSGSHCTLDRIDAYKNGNTGIQISRYMTYDKFEDWPSDDLILNCTSYLNADKGYEDADGFAAKLTVGNNVVFDGCISYYNADDGWDLFAKVETGSIGMVTVKNSVAYKNGYVLDAEGKDVDAGNGNGFKLGGSSISGHHRLINCVAFDNKCKGIDSNSCPDIQVENCTSFNNESFNVALYTNDAANTDFSASGIISYRSNTNVAENLKLRGTQDETKVYGTNNYYWDTQTQTSKNTEGVAVADDWFVSLDTSKVPTRNADGTINMNGLLELTDKAPADAGARMTGTSSVDTSKLVDTDKKDDDNKGDIIDQIKDTIKDIVTTVVKTVVTIIKKIFGFKFR